MHWNVDGMDAARRNRKEVDVFLNFTTRIMNALDSECDMWQVHHRDPAATNIYEPCYDGKAALFNFMVRDGRSMEEVRTMEKTRLAIISIRDRYNRASPTVKQHIQEEAQELAYTLWTLNFPTWKQVEKIAAEGQLHLILGFGNLVKRFWRELCECGASEYIKKIEQYQDDVINKAGPYAGVLMSPHMTGAVEMSNTPHDNEDIRGRVGDDWPNYIHRKKDTTQQYLAGVPIYQLPKPEGGYESLYHTLHSIPHAMLKNIILDAPHHPAVPSITYHPLIPRPLQLKNLRQKQYPSV